MSVINTHNFGQFWSFSSTITHRFGVPGRFPHLTIPGVRLRVRHQHSQFWPILTHFVDYYSPFSGPKAISMVVEPQGAFTCRSSTLNVSADSGLFRGLLLTVLGSRSDFTINDPRGAFMSRSSTLIVLADSGPFHGLLLIVFWSRRDFHD